MTARRIAPLAALLIAGCALRPLGGSPASEAVQPTSSSVISTSPPTEASVALSGCGSTTSYTWIDASGEKTPDEAFNAFKAAILAQEPADATESTVHAALVSALEIATAADKTGRLVSYEARSGDTMVGVITVKRRANNTYLADRSWVAVPEALCVAAKNGP